MGSARRNLGFEHMRSAYAHSICAHVQPYKNMLRSIFNFWKYYFLFGQTVHDHTRLRWCSRVWACAVWHARRHVVSLHGWHLANHCLLTFSFSSTLCGHYQRLLQLCNKSLMDIDQFIFLADKIKWWNCFPGQKIIDLIGEWRYSYTHKNIITDKMSISIAY